jgi:hypothetical protein
MNLNWNEPASNLIRDQLLLLPYLVGVRKPNHAMTQFWHLLFKISCWKLMHFEINNKHIILKFTNISPSWSWGTKNLYWTPSTSKLEGAYVTTFDRNKPWHLEIVSKPQISNLHVLNCIKPRYGVAIFWRFWTTTSWVLNAWSIHYRCF